MLDIGFNRFLSLTAVSVVWVVTLALAGVYLIASLVVGVYNFGNGSPGWGALSILGGLVGTILFVLLVRLALETVAVLFRIAESARVIAEQTRPAGAPTPQSYSYVPQNHVEYGPRRA